MNLRLEKLRYIMKKKRALLKLKMKDVAAFCNVSAGYISRIEKGTSTPSLKTVIKLSKILEFNIDEVYIEVMPKLNPENTLLSIDKLIMTNDFTIQDTIVSAEEKQKIIKLLNYIYSNNKENKLNYIINIADIIETMNIN